MGNVVNQWFNLSSLVLIIIPWLGVFANALGFKKYTIKRAQFSALIMSVGLIISLLGLMGSRYTDLQAVSFGFKFDGLSWTMSSIILFVSLVVHQFSSRYMAGDRYFQRYFVRLSAIMGFAVMMVCTDNLLLLWAAWTSCNTLLALLMIHKEEWAAAQYSGVLALKSLSLGSLSLLIAFALMYYGTGSSSISFICEHYGLLPKPLLLTVLGLLALTAFIQSAQWPFHRWLTSSLNSPTPISALMHAGLVNAGGFILVRFAPLFLSSSEILNLLFVVGLMTAVLGTFWKLMQTDIKRMLASSTMAQMGFMMMQCGLGLFPAAIAHLCWHGLFKSFLFLNAGSAAQTKRVAHETVSNPLRLYTLSFFSGLLGASCFAIMSEKTIFTLQPTTFLVGVAFIAGAQMSYSLLCEGNILKRLIPVVGLVALSGLLYGASIHFIESFFPHLSTAQLPTLNGLHGAAFVLFFLLWLAVRFDMVKRIQHTSLWKRIYMAGLNGNQPHPKTITAIRKHYQY